MSTRTSKSIQPAEERDRAAQRLTSSSVVAHSCSFMHALNTCPERMQSGLVEGQAGSLFIWVAPCVV